MLFSTRKNRPSPSKLRLGFAAETLEVRLLMAAPTAIFNQFIQLPGARNPDQPKIGITELVGNDNADVGQVITVSEQGKGPYTFVGEFQTTDGANFNPRFFTNGMVDLYLDGAANPLGTATNIQPDPNNMSTAPFRIQVNASLPFDQQTYRLRVINPSPPNRIPYDSDSTNAEFYTFTVKVNRPPTAVNDPLSDIPQDTSKIINFTDLTSNDTDPDINDPANPNDDDRLSLIPVGFTNVSVGSLTVNQNSTLTYTPPANYKGPVTFQYFAQDKEGDLSVFPATVSFNVTAVPHNPIANPDQYSLDENTTFSVNAAQGVLANDTDLDNPGNQFIGTAMLVQNVLPSQGTLTFNSDGSFQFVPVKDFTGAATFTYRDTDNTGLQSAPATVTLNVLSSTEITGVQFDTGKPIGQITTNDNRPNFFGTAEPGLVVTLQRVDAMGNSIGTPLGSATANASGKWEIDYPASMASLPDGVYLFIASAQLPQGRAIPSSPVMVTIDTQPPAPPIIQKIQDDTGKALAQLTNDAKPNFVGTAEPGSVVTVREIGGNVIGTSAPAAALTGQWTVVFTGAPLTDGVHRFVATAQDVAGNVSGDSAIFSITIDTTPPARLAAPDLLASSDTGASSTDNVTMATRPSFAVTGIEPGAKVELFRSPFGSTMATSVATQIVALGGSVTLMDTKAGGLRGSFQYTVKQVDVAGNEAPASPALTVVFDRLAPAVNLQLRPSDQVFTGSALLTTANPRPTIDVNVHDDPSGLPPGGFPPGTPNKITVELVEVDGQRESVVAQPLVLTSSGDKMVTLNPPENLAAGMSHQVTINVTDLAGNVKSVSLQFFVSPNRPAGAPGSPIFETVYDLQKLLAPVVGPAPDTSSGKVPRNNLVPWNISFDRTTQTIWFVLRGEDSPNSNIVDRGHHVVQLDPATGNATVYNLKAKIDPNLGPHSVFFDFESHATPRVWFVERTGGRVGYLDIATKMVVTYELRDTLNRMKNELGLKQVKAEFHAITVDRRGVAWITDPSDKLILELNTRVSAANGGIDVNTDKGTLTVHVVPKSFLNGITDTEAGLGLLGGGDDVGPHGIDTVVDDRTGHNTQPYVYFGILGSGRVGLLIPKNGANGSDHWVSWDVTQGAVGNPLFVTIDNNETPGTPEDDRILLGDPGSSQTSKQSSAIRILTPGAVLSNPILNPGDVLLNPKVLSSMVQSFEVPSITSGKAQPNQVYVDREGNAFFIDRRSGVGRLSSSFGPVSSGMNARVDLGTPLTPQSIDPASALLDPKVQPAAPQTVSLSPQTLPGPSSQQEPDLQPLAGLDQYMLASAATPGGPNGLAGPLRGTINAGSTLYASLSQSDQLGIALFAETARRPMDVVETPSGARMAFQVVRSGHLILTLEPPGSIVDQQFDVTRDGFAGLPAPGFVGDVSAAVDGRGLVHVFGKDERGGLMEYLFDPSTSRWSFHAFALQGFDSGPLASNPTAFELADGSGAVASLITTGSGHLLLFRSDSDTPIDLSAHPKFVPIYGEVGEVYFGGTLFVYGTDMTGSLAQYTVSAQGNSATSARIDLGKDPSKQMFQDVTAIVVNGVRHILGTDGFSELIDVQLDAAGNMIKVENVTRLVQPTADGYSEDYQRPFAGRVYSDVSAAIDPTTGFLFVYGTNGRDLVEFRRSPDGTWQASNLTNDLLQNGGLNTANRVFGAPGVVILPNGDRHILQINEDGEVVEYYKLHGLSFATNNITLAQGNSAETLSFPNALSPPGITQPIDDHPNTIGPAASPLVFNPTTLQAIGTGQIETAGDIDVFQFVAPGTGRITIQAASLTNGFRPILIIQNSHGRVIASNRQAPGRRIQIGAIVGRTYFVTVVGRQQHVGSYVVSLQASSPVGLRRSPPRPVAHHFLTGKAIAPAISSLHSQALKLAPATRGGGGGGKSRGKH